MTGVEPPAEGPVPHETVHRRTRQLTVPAGLDDATIAMLQLTYDGVDVVRLARDAGVPALFAFASVTSTQDVAHRLAAGGTPAGTVVLADEQRAGRGRQGRRWLSDAGRGVWMTLVERPPDAGALAVLSLRLGLAAATVLDGFAPEPVRLKWPNDLYLAAGKLGGILAEARWRDERPEWAVLGVGINVHPPAGSVGVALPVGTQRAALVAALVPALRAAAACRGPLVAAELAAWDQRDLAVGRRVIAPVPGVVHGIDADGGLHVRDDDGVIRLVRGGSLIFEDG